MKAKISSVAMVVLLATLAACSDSKEPLAPQVPIVASVDVVPGLVDIQVGDTLRFKANALSPTGDVLIGHDVTWGSDDERVATVTPTGLVTALAAGKTKITATVASKLGTANLTVHAPPQNTPPNPAPQVSSLAPSSARARGDGFTLTVSGSGFRPSSIVFWNDAPRATDYASEEELVASILAEDIANSGSARVSVFTPAPGGGTSTSVIFTIEPIVVTVLVGPSGAQQWPGEEIQFTATAKDDQGHEVSGRFVEWSSWHPNVATVDAVGRVTARTAGNTIITATVEGVTGMQGITVLPLPAYDLLYEGFRGGMPELWLLTPGNGSLPRRILATGTYARDPAVSPNGEWIAFVGRDANLNTDIYVVTRSGAGLQRLTFDAAIDDQPAWSPDGKQIAFRSERSGYSDIWVMNADGSGQLNLTGSDYRVGNPHAERPAWSPKDGRIVFAMGDMSIRPFSPRLLSMEPDGSNRRVVTNALSDTEPAFSSDGELIALRRGYPQVTDQIAVITADGVELITPYPVGRGYTPAWSPDDEWIAFAHPANDPGIPSDIILTRFGEPARKLVTVGVASGGGANPTWIPR